MATTFDNSGSTSSAAGVTSLTTAGFAITGSNLVMVALAGTASLTSPTISEIRWDGSTGTLFTLQAANSFTGVKSRSGILLSPTTGTRTLYSLFSGTADEAFLAGGSYAGVDQSDTFDFSQSQRSGTSITAPESEGLAARTDSLLVSFAWIANTNGSATSATIAAGPAQTSRQAIDSIANFASGQMTDQPGLGGDTVAIHTTTFNLSHPWDAHQSIWHLRSDGTDRVTFTQDPTQARHLR